MNKKVVAYYRISSLSSEDGDNGSENRQRKACYDYAKKNGIQIVNEFYDADEEGKDLIAGRQGFTSLINFCKSNNIKNIVFENAGRFSMDQITQEIGYRELKRSGYSLICSNKPDYFTDDINSPSIKMVRQILGSAAELQRDEFVIKLRAAREKKKEINKKTGILTINGEGKCEGRKSYKEINPVLIKEVKRLSRKSPKTGKRKSYNQISLELVQLGYLNSKGNKFDPRQVQRILV